jgi:peroxiredoxin Q/BCP
MTLLSLVALLLASAPKVGDAVTDFTATDTEGKAHTLSEVVARRSVVVAFFPRAFTPGCTRQMKAFRDRQAELEKKGAVVWAVSMDDAETLARFKKELGADFTFLPDPDGRISRLFGVAKEGSRTADRKNFVVGEERKILAVESGMFAIDPDDAIAACPMRPAK